MASFGMFDVYENMLFLYNHRNNANFPAARESMKKAIGNESGRFKRLLFDISVMLSCDLSDSYYPNALRRYERYYSSLSDREMYSYARYISKTFEVSVPLAGVEIPFQRLIITPQVKEFVETVLGEKLNL